MQSQKRKDKSMKSNVKRLLVFLIAISLVMSCCTALAASAPNWNKPAKTVKSVGKTIAAKGTVLSEDLFGKVLKVHDNVGGWFLLTIPENVDSLTFSVIAAGLPHDKFTIRFYRALNFENNEFEEIQRLTFADSNGIQTGVLSALKAGDVIAWWNDDCSGKGWTLQKDFKMMITPNVPATVISK